MSGVMLLADLGLLHGEAGTWDELAVVVVGFVVIWVAVKLAGRKRPTDGEAQGDQPILDESEPAPPVAPGR